MILGDLSKPQERKGGVSIQEANAAIETLLDFKPTEFTPEQIKMGMGMGFVLIADGKGLKASHHPDIENGMEKAIEQGLRELPPELRARVTEANLEAIVLAVSIACEPHLKIIAYECLGSYIEKEMEGNKPTMEDFLDFLAHKVSQRMNKE